MTKTVALTSMGVGHPTPNRRRAVMRDGARGHVTLGTLLITGLLLLSPIVPARAGTQTGADFLKLPVGARSVGMGQAITAIPQGAYALNANPAGLGGSAPQTRVEAGLSHQAFFFGTSLDHLSLALAGGGSLWWGVTLTRLSYPSQDARDVNRNIVGQVDASDTAIGVGAAGDWGLARIGLHVKFIRQDLAEARAQGAAVDVGVLSAVPGTPLSIGVAARNLGPSLQFKEERFDLPLTLSAGAAYRLSAPFSLTLDLQTRPRENQTTLGFGVELLTGAAVALRAGYMGRLAERIVNNQRNETNRGNMGGIAGLSAGLGFRTEQLSLDYAVSPFGELGNAHLFSVAARVGRGDASSSRKDVQKPSHPLPPHTPRVIVMLATVPDAEPWWLTMRP